MSTAQRQRAADREQSRRARVAAALAASQAVERRRRARIAAIAATAVVVLVVVAGTAWQSSRSEEQQRGTTPVTATDDGAFLVGDETAPVTVTVFSDYLCPACKRFETLAGPTLDELVEDGTVRLAYHPIAILDLRSTTRYSTRAASAAACAADVGELRPYTEALFAAQPAEGGPGLDDGRLADLGPDDDGFAACVRDRQYAGWVTRSTEVASRAGVVQTPTVLVDGVPLQDWRPESLRAAVEQAAS